MNTHEKTEMTTMTSCITMLQSEGYTENFIMSGVGLEAPSNKKLYVPEEVKINSFYRFEGESDPADNAIVYAIETNDSVKGIIIDSYGVSASQKISKFIKEVETINKREAGHEADHQ